MNGRKYGIFLGAVAIALLMVSTATALPTVDGKVATDYVDKSTTEQDESFIDYLMSMYNQLKKDGVIDSENQDLQNMDLTQDSDQSLYLDLGEFINYIISDEFIQLLNENYDDILSNIGFQLLWDTEYVQEYVQSEEFINFVNTDEVQYILDNLDIESDDQQVIQTQTVNVNCQVLLGQNEQKNTINGMSQAAQTQTYNTQSDITIEGSAAASSENILPTTDLLAAWIIILIGLVTWIPAIIFVVLSSPVYLIYEWIVWVLSFWIEFGYPFPIVTALGAFFDTILYVIVNVTCWPVIWMYFFEWWIPTW